MSDLPLFAWAAVRAAKRRWRTSYGFGRTKAHRAYVMAKAKQLISEKHASRSREGDAMP